MAAAPDPWASIKAAFLREGEYAAIATARKLGIRTLDVIPAIREWKSAAAAEKAPPPRSEIVVTSAPISVIESVTQVEKDQKRLVAQLRAVLEHELEETQVMSRMTSSFVDADRLEELKAKALTGDAKPLVEYLRNAASARRMIVEHVEKLARAINQAVQSERSVWGLDADPSKRGNAEATDWHAILEELRTPVAPLTLPPGVVDFESKLRERESAGRR